MILSFPHPTITALDRPRSVRERSRVTEAVMAKLVWIAEWVAAEHKTLWSELRRKRFHQKLRSGGKNDGKKCCLKLSIPLSQWNNNTTKSCWIFQPTRMWIRSNTRKRWSGAVAKWIQRGHFPKHRNGIKVSKMALGLLKSKSFWSNLQREKPAALIHALPWRLFLAHFRAQRHDLVSCWLRCTSADMSYPSTQPTNLQKSTAMDRFGRLNLANRPSPLTLEEIHKLDIRSPRVFGILQTPWSQLLSPETRNEVDIGGRPQGSPLVLKNSELRGQTWRHGITKNPSTSCNPPARPSPDCPEGASLLPKPWQ